MEEVGTNARPGSGGGSAQQARDTASPTPQLGGHPVGLILCFHERRVIVGRMNFNCVAKTLVADQIQSIIHLDPPARLSSHESMPVR